jgi:hypothetical protein
MIQIKLIGMSIISYYTKVHLSKCNGCLHKTKYEF